MFHCVIITNKTSDSKKSILNNIWMSIILGRTSPLTTNCSVSFCKPFFPRLTISRNAFGTGNCWRASLFSPFLCYCGQSSFTRRCGSGWLLSLSEINNSYAGLGIAIIHPACMSPLKRAPSNSKTRRNPPGATEITSSYCVLFHRRVLRRHSIHLKMSTSVRKSNFKATKRQAYYTETQSGWLSGCSIVVEQK